MASTEREISTQRTALLKKCPRKKSVVASLPIGTRPVAIKRAEFPGWAVGTRSGSRAELPVAENRPAVPARLIAE